MSELEDQWRKKRNEIISDTPILLSLLYDLDLLPEQVTNGTADEWRMNSVVRHFTKIPTTLLPKPTSPVEHKKEDVK